MLPLKLITFDVTETLLFFRTPILKKYAESGLKFGIKSDSSQLKKNFIEAWTTLNEEHPNFGKETGLAWEKWWTNVVEKTFSESIPPKEKHKITEIAKDLIEYHTTKEAFNVCPGAVDLLGYLRAKSQRPTLGVISNYDPRLHRILELTNLKQFFDFILISYEVGFGKPDARIFQKALRLGSCSLGQEALHVGNDVVKDYLGAKKAGLRSLLVTSDEKDFNNSQIQKNEIFKDFFELKTYFQGMEQKV